MLFLLIIAILIIIAETLLKRRNVKERRVVGHVSVGWSFARCAVFKGWTCLCRMGLLHCVLPSNSLAGAAEIKVMNVR